MALNYLDLDLADTDSDGIADGLTGEGPWGVDDFEAEAPADGLAHQLSITSPDDLSGATITLRGRDADGKEISETVTGPNQTTVETNKYFASLESVESSVNIGSDEFDIGWVDEAVSKTIRLNWRADSGVNVRAVVTGTIDYDVEFTNDDLDNPRNAEQADLPWFIADSDLEGETTSKYVQAPAGLTGARVKVNSYSSGARLQVYTSQPDRQRLDF